METKPRSWWQKVKKPLEVFVIIVVCVLVTTLIVVITLAYIFKVNVPGLSGKNLWDWLQLLIIPAVLAVGGYVFTYTTSRNDRAAAEKRTQTERDIAADNQRETALQAYIDKISELLLKEHLGEQTEGGKLKPEYEQVRNIARVRTITVLTQLDARRVGYVFAFLREAGLLSATSNDNAVSLSQADLRAVNWSQARLSAANLRGADLRESDLSGASLILADLSWANLLLANLSEANLSEANLSSSLQLHFIN